MNFIIFNLTTKVHNVINNVEENNKITTKQSKAKQNTK